MIARRVPWRVRLQWAFVHFLDSMLLVGLGVFLGIMLQRAAMGAA